MINKFKNNTQIKIIAIISALALWLYVMIVEDPQDKKLIEGVPVHITNIAELEDRGFVVFPDNDITADVFISGNLSRVRSTTVDNIYVYGEIKNPIEGQNTVILNANVSENVSYSLRSPAVSVNLERVVEEEKAIKVNIKGQKKDDISEVKLEKNTVTVSGPRSMVNNVNHVEAELNVETGKDSFTRNLKLTPVDEDGKKVEDVELSADYVKANVEMFKQNTVPIKFNLKDDTTKDITSYNVSNKEVVIKGRKEAVEAIDSIETSLIDLKQLDNVNEIIVDLVVPIGITTEFSTITISNKAKEYSNNSFTFNSSEIELRNGIEEGGVVHSIIDLAEVKVDIEYDSALGEVKKSDIKLYVDLGYQSTTNNKYIIKYESNFNLNNVNITPNDVEVQ